MKRAVLSLLLFICMSFSSVFATEPSGLDRLQNWFYENKKNIRITGYTVAGAGAAYLTYQLIFMQSEVAKARQALNQYLWDMQLIIAWREYHSLDVGSGYCLQKFNELKPSFALLSESTLQELEKRVVVLDTAFSEKDNFTFDKEYKAIEKYIDTQCRKELARKARIHNRKKSFLEKAQYALHRIGVNIIRVFCLNDEDAEEDELL